MWAEREVVPTARRRTFPTSDLIGRLPRKTAQARPLGMAGMAALAPVTSAAPAAPAAPTAHIRSSTDDQVNGCGRLGGGTPVGVGHGLRGGNQVGLGPPLPLRGLGPGDAVELDSYRWDPAAGSPTMLKISALDLMSKELTSRGREPPATRLGVELVADPTWSHRPAALRAAAAASATRSSLRSGLAQGLAQGLSPTLSEAEEDALLRATPQPDSFRCAIHLAVAIGQCVSLLPTSARPDIVPRFRLLSFRALYSTCVTLGLFANAVLSIVHTFNRTTDVNSITASSAWMFYVSATSVSVLYFRLATQWRCLCLCFLRVEARMRDFGDPPHLRLRLKTTTIVVLSLALVEHTLAISSGIIHMEVSKYNAFADFLRDYFDGNYPHLLLVIPYSPALLVLVQMLNTAATFMWNYNDLFIMLVSVAIAQRFKLLNSKLNESPKKEKTREFWRDAREKFNALAVLTREVDRLLCVQILFSFMNNLYFICIQLLRTVKHDQNSVVHVIYFLYSFAILIMRTVFVSIFAASINDESKNVRKVLYSVSSTSYCEEVDRFIIQATTDEIALTGMKFFNVTRSFLLTVAGTIATYEIVLVQFNGNKKTW